MNDIKNVVVQFTLFFGENKKENLKVESENDHKSPTLDQLFILLDDEICNFEIDDSVCINLSTDSELINT